MIRSTAIKTKQPCELRGSHHTGPKAVLLHNNVDHPVALSQRTLLEKLALATAWKPKHKPPELLYLPSNSRINVDRQKLSAAVVRLTLRQLQGWYPRIGREEK